MNPHIILKIENHTPHLYFHPENGENRQLTKKDTNLEELIINIADQLGIKTEGTDRLQDLLQLASESDELYNTELPVIDVESLELDVENPIMLMLSAMNSTKEDYSTMTGISDELRTEIERNRDADIFASVLDKIYSIIIAKALLAAHDLEIPNIRLSSENNYPRLAEKMGNELQKLGIEFEIV
jgi:hypothetical protein